MKVAGFRSIRARLMAATTLLILAIVSVLVWSFMTREQEIQRRQKQDKARSFAGVLGRAWTNEVVDENWNQIRVGIRRLVVDNDDLVYAIVTHARLNDFIIASVPKDLQRHYVPDVVPASVSRAAWEVEEGLLEEETYLLRDVRIGDGPVRGRRGERIIEVAAPILNSSDQRVGVMRVGISLADVDAAVAGALRRALLVGGASLLLGVAGAWFLSRRLSRGIESLQASAAKIAGGDLEHRAQVHRSDEIGALARSFNDMTEALQRSFSVLRKTLRSFERFVPAKFIKALAPGGVENIAVGTSAAREMTILFSDIRGYTSMADAMEPQEIFDFLNDYLARMAIPIAAHGGFIDKYIGDAVMALFDHDTSDGAIRAALGMQAAVDELNEARRAEGLSPIAIGVGLHRGEVVMGTVGSEDRIDSTVVGDAVNLAARVEGLTKDFQRGVLITEDAAAALSNETAFRLKILDAQVKVKGKDDPIAVYHVTAA